MNECGICEGMCCGQDDDIVNAAIAYVTEPEGSDLIPQYWHELKDAVSQHIGESSDRNGAKP